MSARYRFGLVLEHALGHITHGMYLKHHAALDPEIDFEAMPVDPRIAHEWGYIPRLRYNWNLIGSLAARRRVQAANTGGKLDLAYIHTQVMGFFMADIARKIPVVLSMDATPINLDTFGTYFGHHKDDSKLVAWLKRTGNVRMYKHAAKVITLNKWAEGSLIRDYGVSPEKVVTIPPGVDVTQWNGHRRKKRPGEPMKVLFVGGHFERKGGFVLLKAFGQLPPGVAELDVVAEVVPSMLPAPAGVRYHGRLPNNSPELIRLYADADLFVLPTYADLNCLVIMEALAMRLPVITTNVGGLAEQVMHGVNGFVMERDDVEALARSICTLARDPDLRLAMGEAGRAHVEKHFNARVNYPRILSVLKACVEERRAGVRNGDDEAERGARSNRQSSEEAAEIPAAESPALAAGPL